MAILEGVQDFGFQWSTDEQVYPFEKASDGSTLYCKEVSIGDMPVGGWKYVPLNIPNINRIYRQDFEWGGEAGYHTNTYAYAFNTYVQSGITNNKEQIWVVSNITAYSLGTGILRLFYTKS